MNIFLKRVFDIDAPDWEQKKDLIVELHHGSQLLYSSQTFEDVLDEIEINARCNLDAESLPPSIQISVQEDKVLTKMIVSKVKIPLPTESCTKIYKLASFDQEMVFGKIEISFEVIKKKKEEETNQILHKLTQLDNMIASLQTDLKRLEEWKTTLAAQKPTTDPLPTTTPTTQLPSFLQLGKIPPVILRSRTSGKQLRINPSGRVDCRGNYGYLTMFNICRLNDNHVRLQSVANRKRYLRIDNMNVDGLGGQGNLTEFQMHYMGRHTFAFESVYHYNHYLACDQDGRCSVVIGDQPNLTRFVMIMTGQSDDN